MTTAAEIQAAVAKIVVLSDKMDTIVNGGPTEVVTTDGGPVKTFSGLQQEVRDGAADAAADAISTGLVAGTGDPIYDSVVGAYNAILPGIAAETARNTLRTEARALIYGIPDRETGRLFAAEGTELAFADNFYREGYLQEDLSQINGWKVNNGPATIDGRGLLVTGNVTPEILMPTTGDVTIVAEVDMPALNALTKVLVSYVGADIFSNVIVYRNDAGYYQMQVVRPGEATLTATGPQDATARRMRFALTIGATTTRISFAGQTVLQITTPRPAVLNRLWLGRQALGYGNSLEGRIVRLATFPFSVDNDLLRTMAGGPVNDYEISELIDQRIRTHDNDSAAHELDASRRRLELADSKTGIWTIKAADTFSGVDGSALGNSETGGLTWTTPAGLVRKGGRVRHPSDGYGGAWLNSGVFDGQVEADLYPGTSEASLYARLNAATTQWILLQRAADGGISLNIQFGGTTTRLAPLLSRPVVAGERYKIRFIGPRIWVFRVVSGVEELLFDVTESRLSTEVIHGVRLNGGGSIDNFRILQREAI